MSEKKYPWPEWALTAYVLNELNPDLAEQIRKAEASDADLAAEIVALRATLDQVSALFKNETQGIEATQFDATHATINSKTTPGALANAVAETGADRSIDKKIAMGKWVGLATLAASIAAAAYFLRPSLLDGALKPESSIAQASMPKGNIATVSADDFQGESESSTFASNAAGAKLPESSPHTMRAPSSGHPTGAAPFAEGSSGMSGPSTKGTVKSTAPESQMSLANIPEELHENLRAKDLASSNATPAGIAAPARGGMGSVADMGGMGSEGGMEGGGGRMGGSRSNPKAKSGPAAPASSLPGNTGYGGMGGLGNNGMQTGLSSVADRDESNSQFSINHALSEDAKRILPHPVPGPGGYGSGTDRYQSVPENEFLPVNEQPLSTFSIDVDSASYVKTRQFLMQSNQLPPPAAVRIEDFINYFDYEYAGPQGDDPFAANLAVANCPWQPSHKLVRIALQATKVDVRNRPKANIVFLLDVSGSMDQPNKLPLVKESMRMLIQQLGENDRIAMVVYAGAAGCVLESTRGDQQELILSALDRLNAGGSTNGGQGIQLAYDLARDHFVPGGINRVILCTDGDFNVGVTNTDSLVNLVAQNAKSKIFLTVLGFGMGNTNDAMMEQISNKGNGLYGFVDSHREARRQMVQQLAGNLMTVAKDVKIQVEFNPQHVASYRLIGYENRKLENRDFADDKKDAGEIGAGHRVTALYEIVPVNANDRVGQAEVDELRYGKKKTEPVAAPFPADDTPLSRELLTVKLRYKQPEGDTSKLLTFPLLNQAMEFSNADRDFQWAASMAQFGMLLRNSRFKGDATWSSLTRLVENAAGVSPDANRQECIDMIRTAASLGSR